MPHVVLEILVHAPSDLVWGVVSDVVGYPEYMENVREVTLVDVGPDGERILAWTVILKGSVLQWIEVERINEKGRRIDFDQRSGDLETFRGHWQVCDSANGTIVELDIEFEIGIPMLAEMLNPVAERALRDNSEQMLRALEMKVATR